MVGLAKWMGLEETALATVELGFFIGGMAVGYVWAQFQNEDERFNLMKTIAEKDKQLSQKP